MTKFRIFAARLAGIVFIAVAPASAAQASSDQQIWVNGAVTVKLSDSWRLSEDIVARFSDRREGLYEIESATLIGYKPTKDITVAAGYVHNPQYQDGDFRVMEHRAREQVTFDNLAMIGKGKFGARLRAEQRWREHVDGTGWRLRPYFKFSIPLRGKLALNLSNETFVNLNRTPFQSRTGVDRMRNLVTLSVPLTKTMSGEAGYMNQHGFVRHGEDTSDNIAYFAVSLSL